MKTKEAIDILENWGLICGRTISAYKESPKGCICVWNANIITKSSGKVWYGDLNLTREGKYLKKMASEIGEPLYILREMDCRFSSENDSVKTLIERSFWNTDMEIPVGNTYE